MTLELELNQRCNGSCELCGVGGNLSVFSVPATEQTVSAAEGSLMLCDVCNSGAQTPQSSDANHWRCLNTSMWSQVGAVQVMVWRTLHRLKDQSWTQELIDALYLDPETLAWADADLDEDDANSAPTLDSNGTALADGDTITLIKDLVVKGAGFTAKRGTTVKNISLTSNPLHIEGRVNGTQIVLVAAFLKKA